MKLRLRVLNGPLKGRFTPIKAGDIIGRGQGKIGLKDPKISSNHAEIVANQAGQLILKDLGSRNGIKVEGKRVKQVILTPDTEFLLGQSEIRVETFEKTRRPQAVQDLPPLPENVPTPEPEPEEVAEIEVPPPEWPEYFQEFIATTRSKIKDKQKDLVPFPQMLQLKFLRGPHIDTVWSMGYGPRIVGRGSLDFPIFDDDVPDLAFRIRSKGTDILLETPHSKLVRLNEKFVSTEELSDGDLISVGASLIQVSIKET